MKKNVLKEYAKLIIKLGLNVQKGQDVMIFCELDQIEFIQMLVREAYSRGASRVHVEWKNQETTKLDYRYRTQKSLGTLENFELARWQYRAERLPATLYIISESPSGLDGIKHEKITKSKADVYPFIKPFRDAMEGKYQWCIAAAPSVKWAKQIFPELSKNAAVERLWKAILYASRANENPIENWEKHNAVLKSRCEALNALKLDKLIYRSASGTRLSVGLNKCGRFLGGEEKTLGGITFNPNIPSEEVYVTPDYKRADGIVYASKPLSYEGQLIEDICLEFKNGKVVSAKASKNEELLKKMLALDEGASSLGECAFVPFDSPINNTSILFYETLFDENACCHLALGRGFIESYSCYENLSLDELYEKGINRSMIHVDFMIGTDDLEIVGISENGTETTIFSNGNWANEI